MTVGPYQRSSAWRVGMLIFAVALIAQVMFWFLVPRATLTGDEGEYDLLARNLAAGEGFTLNGRPTTLRPPGYPFFLAGIYASVGHSVWSARAAQAVVVALGCWVLYRLGMTVVDEPAARWGALLMAVYPPIAALSGQLLSEGLFTALLLGSTWALAQGLVGRGRLFFAWAGLGLGFAALTRPVGAPLPFFFLLVIPWFWRPRREVFMGLILTCVVAVGVWAPWTVRNYVQFRRIIPLATKAGIVYWAGTHLPSDGLYDHPIAKRELIRLVAEFHGVPYSEDDLKYDGPFRETLSPYYTLDTDRYLFGKAWENIQDNPYGFVRLLPKKAFRMWVGSYSPSFAISESLMGLLGAKSLERRQVLVLAWKFTMVGVSVFVLLAAMIGALVGSANRLGALFLGLVPIYLTIFHLVPDAHTRFGLPGVPFLLILAVLGVRWARERLVRPESAPKG